MDWDESWREACLEVLRLRRLELKEEQPSKGLSWQGIRDEIMRDFDQYDGERKAWEDTRLRRQDLANFDKGMRVRADKFSFIDLYVRQLDVAGMSDNIRMVLRHRAADRNLKMLASIYAAKSLERKKTALLLSQLSGNLYSQLPEGLYKSLIIKPDYVSEHGASFILGYCRKPLQGLQYGDARAIDFYQAYLVPISFESPSEEMFDNAVSTVPIKGGRLRCVLKAFRPEYQGLSSYGYAEGEALIENVQHAGHGDRLVQELNVSITRIDHPNQISQPEQADIYRTKEFSHIPVLITEKESFLPFTEGTSLFPSKRRPADIKIKPIRPLPNPRADQVSDHLIGKYFKGYIF